METVEDLETDLLLEAVVRRYGHDFRGYRREPLMARLHAFMRAAGLRTVSSLQEQVLHDDRAGAALLRALSARQVALFDDPAFFRALRAAMVPWLRSCPSPALWLAECVCAEEACALAILLAEEGLLDRTRIFATAQNEALLQEAGNGSFVPERLPEYRYNYHASGGKAALDDYCSEQGGRVVFSAHLGTNITWAQYSLATDASFNEFQVILCRHVLPGFGAALRRRTLQLFHDSMPLFGLLGIGGPGGLDVVPFTARYQAISAEQGLYRRVA